MRAKGTITNSEQSTASTISRRPRLDHRKAGSSSSSEVNFTITPAASANVAQPGWSRRSPSHQTMPAIM